MKESPATTIGGSNRSSDRKLMQLLVYNIVEFSNFAVLLILTAFTMFLFRHVLPQTQKEYRLIMYIATIVFCIVVLKSIIFVYCIILYCYLILNVCCGRGERVREWRRTNKYGASLCLYPGDRDLFIS